MAIESVDMARALTSASYAQQVLRSGLATADEKGQLIAQWGAENVNKWTSQDGTEYKIDDVSYDAAKKASQETVKESVGHDGSNDSYAQSISSAAGAGAAAVGALAPSVLGNGICSGLNALHPAIENGTTNQAGWGNTLSEKSGGAKNLGSYATVILAAAVAAKYWASNHNSDQHDAAEKLLENELPQGEAALSEAQVNMAEATEEMTELSEQAEEVNGEAADEIEEKKTLFDFYKQQYEAVKLKADNGETLTPDEKALLRQLAPLMGDLSEGITALSEDTSEEVQALYDDMGEYQDAYDESAETMAEVEGVTDFAEGFDETSRTQMYIEGAAQGLNAASATRAAIKLSTSGWWNWAFAAIGYGAAASSGIASSQQFLWAGDMSEEIDARRMVQEFGEQTAEQYDEEIANYATNLEVVEDLELEIPEDMEVPDETVPAGAEGGSTTRAADDSLSPAIVNDNSKKDDVKKDDDKKDDKVK